MIINNINPVLFQVGPFGVRYYGLVYAIGFIVLYLFLRHNVKKGRFKISEDQLDLFLIWLIVGSIFMARVFDVFIYNLPLYKDNFLDFFRIWDGGLAYHGGIVGAVLVTMWFARKHKLRFGDVADLIAVPAALMLAIGKIANYTNSELYGKAADVPWCVVFQKIDSVCRHPVQIYESLSIFIIFGLLLWMYIKSVKTHKQTGGQIFWTFMLLYAITRFIITFYRDEPLLGGLNIGQWLSLILMGVSIYFLHSRNKSKNI